MQSAQEFMEDYLREVAEASKVSGRIKQAFAKRFYSSELQHVISEIYTDREINPESFSLAIVSDQSAHITTTQFVNNRVWKQRYHLKLRDGQWGIHQRDFVCFKCDGTGKWGEDTCSECSGSGWRNPQPQST